MYKSVNLGFAKIALLVQAKVTRQKGPADLPSIGCGQLPSCSQLESDRPARCRLLVGESVQRRLATSAALIPAQVASLDAQQSLALQPS